MKKLLIFFTLIPLFSTALSCLGYTWTVQNPYEQGQHTVTLQVANGQKQTKNLQARQEAIFDFTGESAKSCLKNVTINGQNAKKRGAVALCSDGYIRISRNFRGDWSYWPGGPAWSGK